VVTLGITPDKPETGYGYIERGAGMGEFNGHTAYRVNQFLEKPDLPTAQRFLASGAYYWNSGIFIWQLSSLMEAYRNHLPEFYEKLEQMKRALDAGEAVDDVWRTINPVSIDVGSYGTGRKGGYDSGRCWLERCWQLAGRP